MRLLFLLVFLICSSSLVSKETRRFRVILACDTASQNISTGTHADLSRMKKNMRIIGSRIGITPKITVLKGRSLSLINIRSWLSSIQHSRNDILVFYYSGHGFRYVNTQPKWPFLYLHGQSISGNSICEEIKKAHPRFALVLFDCCNNKISYQKKGTVSLRETDLILSRKSSAQGLRSLFLRSRGIVTMSAASPGEYAITLVGHKSCGSVFTMGLLHSLCKWAPKNHTHWENVLKNTVFFCGRQLYEQQHPVYSIEKVPPSPNSIVK